MTEVMTIQENLIESLNGEYWKSVPDYEGLYEVSNMGRVKSLTRIVYKSNGRKQTLQPQIIKQYVTRYGYKRLCLTKDQRPRKFLAHRLVAMAFLGNEINKDVNHINEVKTDNRIENLEWCTRLENVRHGTCIERRATKQKKPVIQLKNGEIIRVWESINAVSAGGFSVANVSKCCNKERKTHKGFHWEFKK